MTDTPNLALPYILAAQAQKHVTHNEAIRAIDCIVQLAVESRLLAAPPGSPAEGARYVVAAAASGDWTGQSGKIAAFQDGAWAFYAPKEGWIAWITSEAVAIVYASGAWGLLPSNGLVTDHGELTGLGDDDHTQYHTDARGDARYMPVTPTEVGINTTADSTNKLALKSDASLFDNVGNGHQMKINKAAAGDTASQLYQTGYSGRAETGFTGDDDFHFKVSPDGSSWNEAIKIKKETGEVVFPSTGAAYQGQVATGSRMLDGFISGNKQFQVRTRHFARDRISSLQLLFPNWYVNTATGAETAPGASATINASIEYPVGVFTQVMFSASATGTIPDGGSLLSDDVAVQIPDGAEFFVRSFFQCTAGVPYTLITDAAHGEQADAAASGITDKTMGGDIGGAGGAGYYPIAIVGETTKPSVLLVGDSRAAGGYSGDTPHQNSARAAYQQALYPAFGVLNIAVQGDTFVHFIASHAKRVALAAYCSHVIIEYGINDFTAGRTATQALADLATVIGYFSGKKIWAATVEPKTTSTDSWATVANQTSASGNSERTSYNDNLRGGIAGLEGIFDVADILESSRNSGKWRVTGSAGGYTADGLHAAVGGKNLVADSGIIDAAALRPAISRLPGFATPNDVAAGKAADLIVSPAALLAGLPGVNGVDVQRFTSSGTWTKPIGAKAVRVTVTGSGGSGGGGGKAATSTAVSGGGGGGGAARRDLLFDASVLGATETVTVAAATSGGAGATTNGAGTNGSQGGASSFGTWLTAFGGGGGSGGNASTASGGGGSASTRNNGATASAGTGGSGGAGLSASGGSGVAAGNSLLPMFGAPGGGCSAVAVAGSGGIALEGAGGGAAGGGVTAANVFQAGATNAKRNSAGTIAGGASDGANGTAGVTSTQESGEGGGGGAGSVAGNGGTGGAGGTPGGAGGGGGGSQGGNGGVGGAGGRGEVLVITYR